MPASNKQLGAKEMFNQSLVYLYNSYREDGLTKQQASKNVTEHMESTYKKYSEMGMLSKQSKIFRS